MSEVSNLAQAVNDFLEFEKKIKLSDSQISKLIEQKNIYRTKNKIFIHLPINLIQAANDLVTIEQQYTITPADILLEDEAIILVNKPSGLPAQATLDPNRDHLYAAVERYLFKQNPNSYCALLHRLDVETSGVMIFSKKKSMNKKLQMMFEKRDMKKTYLAIAQAEAQIPTTVWTQNNFLKKAPGKLLKMQEVKSGGDKAITEFKILKQQNQLALIEAKPQTGRTHQIRVHLAQSRLPILGDTLYGTNTSEVKFRLMLHAWKLEFIHPKLDTKMEVTAPVPPEFEQLISL